MMFLVVTTVSLLVFIYAVGYMHGDVRVTFFFAALSLFAGSMLVLVAAPNLVQLIIGWEGVGLASYLLIGHYWEKKENSSAAMKAFYVNRVADIGLTIGAIILGVTVGTFRFTEILEAAEAGLAALGRWRSRPACLIFFGAMGKSAQFPLHVWLPDAMAGPTPVSALMHAATMVTAGVYLIARLFPFYEEMAVGSPHLDHVDRRDHPVCDRPDRPGPGRHQEGAGLLDGQPTRLHGRRPRAQADMPPVSSTCGPTPSSRLALPRGGVGDPRRPFQQHVRHGRPQEGHAGHLPDHADRSAGLVGHPAAGGLLLEG